MSYILDALRKADAQRERDPARGIHAQSLQGGASDGEARNARTLSWIALGAGVCVVAAAGWYVMRPAARSPVVPQGQTNSQVAVASAEAPVVRMQPPAAVPPPAAQVLPPPVVTERPQRPQKQAPSQVVGALAPDMIPVQAPAPLAMQASAPTPAPLIAAPIATGQPPGMMPSHGPFTPPGIPAAQPRAAAPIPPSAPLPPVQGLPADAPKLVINGGVYSASREQRMLIVNGQVVREGADLGSGVKLEQITARSTAVLSFRGARYAVSY